MLFPTTRPDDAASASALWSIQMDLLSRAEAVFGRRDTTKKIFQPVFEDTNPHLINTPTFDGAFVALSRNAAGHWPTTIYEMAHETTHLLDPIAGRAKWIEEGAAVAFSIFISRTLTDHPMAPVGTSVYSEALSLVERLPVDDFPHPTCSHTRSRQRSLILCLVRRNHLEVC
jgi:hypothetical protein